MKNRKKYLFNIAPSLAVLVYILILSFTRYDQLNFLGILAVNLGETLCSLIIVINFRVLVNWKVSDIKYHVRMTIFLSLVTAVTFNMLVFKNPYNDYLMILSVIAAFFAFYFIYRHQKDKGEDIDIKKMIEKQEP